MTEKDLPLILRAEKAKNELRYHVNQTSVKYDLPGFFIDLILESVLSEERAQRIALMTEQITLTNTETDTEKEENHGERENTPE